MNFVFLLVTNKIIFILERVNILFSENKIYLQNKVFNNRNYSNILLEARLAPLPLKLFLLLLLIPIKYEILILLYFDPPPKISLIDKILISIYNPIFTYLLSLNFLNLETDVSGG